MNAREKELFTEFAQAKLESVEALAKLLNDPHPWLLGWRLNYIQHLTALAGEFFNPPVDCDRADGSCLCPACKRPFSEHPGDVSRMAQDGSLFLTVLCDGTRVKL